MNVARITEVHFDRQERPFRAVIRTRLGVVEVQWRDVRGDLCWFTNGISEAKKLAVPAIERLNRIITCLQHPSTS
jgi:hypothetical protein